MKRHHLTNWNLIQERGGWDIDTIRSEPDKNQHHSVEKSAKKIGVASPRGNTQ